MSRLESLIRIKQAAMSYADRERVLDAGKGVVSGSVGLPLLIKGMDILNVWAKKPTRKTYAAAALLGGALGGVRGFGKNPPREERVEWLQSLDKNK